MARVYDTLIGGKDNYEPDRGAAAELAEITPHVALVAGENKQFAVDTVRWLADQGVTQFLDLGCGMPVAPNTHETAQAATPGARVAYVDIDPIAVGHMGTFARPGSGVISVQSDVSDSAATRAAVAEVIDFTKPVGVLMCALLHFYDADGARALIAAYTADLAPGSYLAASVIGSEGSLADRFVRAYSAAIAPVYAYSAAEVASLFSSFELVPPGVTSPGAWQPGLTEVPTAPVRDFGGHVAVARVGDAAG